MRTRDIERELVRLYKEWGRAVANIVILEGKLALHAPEVEEKHDMLTINSSTGPTTFCKTHGLACLKQAH